MSQIFDRLGNLIKSAFAEDPDDFDFSFRNSDVDPDMKSAWDELNDFLNEDDGFENTEHSSHTYSNVPEELRKDYDLLEVSFGAPMDVVKKAYKKQAIKYHPDRFINEPDQLKRATEMMKRLNIAYQNIKNFEKNKTKR